VEEFRRRKFCLFRSVRTSAFSLREEQKLYREEDISPMQRFKVDISKILEEFLKRQKEEKEQKGENA